MPAQERNRSMLRLWDLAREVYGDGKVADWFETPQPELRNKTPAEISQNSSEGFDLMEKYLLDRINNRKLFGTV